MKGESTKLKRLSAKEAEALRLQEGIAKAQEAIAIPEDVVFGIMKESAALDEHQLIRTIKEDYQAIEDLQKKLNKAGLISDAQLKEFRKQKAGLDASLDKVDKMVVQYHQVKGKIEEYQRRISDFERQIQNIEGRDNGRGEKVGGQIQQVEANIRQIQTDLERLRKEESSLVAQKGKKVSEEEVRKKLEAASRPKEEGESRDLTGQRDFLNAKALNYAKEVADYAKDRIKAIQLKRGTKYGGGIAESELEYWQDRLERAETVLKSETPCATMMADKGPKEELQEDFSKDKGLGSEFLKRRVEKETAERDELIDKQLKALNKPMAVCKDRLKKCDSQLKDLQNQSKNLRQELTNTKQKYVSRQQELDRLELGMGDRTLDTLREDLRNQAVAARILRILNAAGRSQEMASVLQGKPLVIRDGGAAAFALGEQEGSGIQARSTKQGSVITVDPKLVKDVPGLSEKWTTRVLNKIKRVFGMFKEDVIQEQYLESTSKLSDHMVRQMADRGKDEEGLSIAQQAAREGERRSGSYEHKDGVEPRDTGREHSQQSNPSFHKDQSGREAAAVARGIQKGGHQLKRAEGVRDRSAPQLPTKEQYEAIQAEKEAEKHRPSKAREMANRARSAVSSLLSRGQQGHKEQAKRAEDEVKGR